jgi:hypothetical protein
MSSPALLHLLARRAKRKCGAAGSEPVNGSGSEAAAGAPTSRLSFRSRSSSATVVIGSGAQQQRDRPPRRPALRLPRVRQARRSEPLFARNGAPPTAGVRSANAWLSRRLPGGRFHAMLGDIDADAGALVSDAVRQTMRGGAKFTFACRIGVPGYDADDQYVGLVDFDHDRCRLDPLADPDLDSAAQSLVFAGPVCYLRQADGCWTWTRGAPGTHNALDLHWSLEALVRARRSAAATDEQTVEVSLDYEALNAGTDIGFSRDWSESTAVVELSPTGTIARPALTHRNSGDPGAWMHYDFRISEQPSTVAIELPAPEATIPLEHYRR